MAVEFLPTGKGHMVHVHIETHTNRIGRHKKINFARLVERHLCVACARGKSPHHNSGATALAADKFR